MRRLASPAVLLLVAALVGGLLPLAAPVPPARAAVTFTVTSTGDVGDAEPEGACDSNPTWLEVECTLREAIQEANFSPGADTITFGILNLPSSPAACDAATGVCTIRPATTLPAVTRPLTIDGYTQPGASPNTRARGTNAVLRIELDGSDAPGTGGLRIEARDTVVRGLVINRFNSTGIRVSGAATTGVQIAGCFVGTDASGTFGRGNERGLALNAPNAIVGGDARADRNLIAGNDVHGIELPSSAPGGRVQGNLIGTDKTGAAPLGNGSTGVFTFATDTVIGGDDDAANIIAFNGGDGVLVSGGTGNRILRNSVFANGGLGIDLRGGTEDAAGATANDEDDHDLGPNGLQNTPVLRAATTTGAATTVGGRFNSTPNKTFTLRFFANRAGEDEGRTYLGEQSVTANAVGNVSFIFGPDQKVAVGKTITATATGPGGNTSEFSAARTVDAGGIGG